MKKTMLITRPEHDDTTHYLSSWSKEAIIIAQKKGILVLDLHREKANKKITVSMLSKQNPTLIVFNGHGTEAVVCGHNKEPLLIAEKNEQLLKDKIVYAISCKSAKELGPKSVQSGAKAYIGYNDDFIFFYDPKKITYPLEDETAKLFLEPSYELIISLIKGNAVEESCKRSKRLFEDNIRKLLSSKATEEETSMARYLWWDSIHQDFLGYKESSF